MEEYGQTSFLLTYVTVCYDFGAPLWAKIHFDFSSLPSNATFTMCIARFGQHQALSAFKVTGQKTEFHEIYLDFSVSLSRMEGMSVEGTSLKEVHVRNLDRHQAYKLALTNPV